MNSYLPRSVLIASASAISFLSVICLPLTFKWLIELEPPLPLIFLISFQRETGGGGGGGEEREKDLALFIMLYFASVSCTFCAIFCQHCKENLVFLLFCCLFLFFAPPPPSN